MGWVEKSSLEKYSLSIELGQRRRRKQMQTTLLRVLFLFCSQLYSFPCLIIFGLFSHKDGSWSVTYSSSPRSLFEASSHHDGKRHNNCLNTQTFHLENIWQVLIDKTSLMVKVGFRMQSKQDARQYVCIQTGEELEPLIQSVYYRVGLRRWEISVQENETDSFLECEWEVRI